MQVQDVTISQTVPPKKRDKETEEENEEENEDEVEGPLHTSFVLDQLKAELNIKLLDSKLERLARDRGFQHV